MRPSLLLALLLLPGTAEAYVGPGAGIGALGAVLAVLGTILLAILGFFWYPLKRLAARLRGGPSGGARGQGRP
jgi:hypothetical protein